MMLEACETVASCLLEGLCDCADMQKMRYAVVQLVLHLNGLL